MSGYLRQLPALLLLDRLPTAMFGVTLAGDVTYANPAFAEMLGYRDQRAVSEERLIDLLTGHQDLANADCLHTLRSAGALVDWNHCHGYTVRTTVSAPLLLRSTDPLLLVGVTDVTAGMWETAKTTRRGPHRVAPSAHLAEL